MPRGLSTEIKTAIAAGIVKPVYLAYFNFDGYVLRTWTGEGDLSYASETWSGNGYLQTLPAVGESASLVAGAVEFALTGKPDTAVDLSDPDKYQGRAVELYIGFYAADGTLPATNIYKLFSGTMSQVAFSSDAHSEAWTVTAESRLVDLQRVKSALWTHEEQRSRYAADNGFAYESAARTAVALFRDQEVPGPASRAIIYGQRRLPGQIVFAATSGSASKYLNLVIAVADHECESVEQVYIDDRALLSAGVVAGEFVGFVDYYSKLGTDAQTYIAALETEVGTSVWDSDCRLRGVCYVYLRLLSSDNVFGDTLPSIEVEVKGKKLYDPRTTTTVYSTNAALAVRDYLLASSGFGAAAGEIADTAFSTAADICDQLVDKADTSSEPRYRASGVIDAGVTIGENLQTLTRACAGVLTYSGGKFVLLAGKWVAAALTITEADLLGGEAVSNLSRRSWSNGAKGVYISADNNWSEENYPNFSSAAFVTADGESRYLVHDLPLTTSPSAAQRLAKIAVLDTRRSRELSLLTRVEYLELICGDVVSVTLDRLGYTAKDFRVEAMRLEASGLALGLSLDLREIGSTHYDWDETTEELSLQSFTEPTDVLENWVNAKLAPPSGSPTSQSFSATFNVTVSHNETGATCHYTLDGSEPDETDASVTDGGTISIVHDNTDKVLKLKTFETAGDLVSDVVTYNYTAILTAPAATAVYVTIKGATSFEFDLVWSHAATSQGEDVSFRAKKEDGNWIDDVLTWRVTDGQTATNWWDEYDQWQAQTMAAGQTTATAIAPRQFPPPYVESIVSGSYTYVGASIWGGFFIQSRHRLGYRVQTRADNETSNWSSWGSWQQINEGTTPQIDDAWGIGTALAAITALPLNKSGTLYRYELRQDTYDGILTSDIVTIEGQES